MFMRIVLFDDNPSALLPFTYLKPSWDVNAGGAILREWLAAQFPGTDVVARPGAYAPQGLPIPHVALNGRLLPSHALAQLMKALMQGGSSVQYHDADGVIACGSFMSEEGGTPRPLPEDVCLARGPWDIIMHLNATLAHAAEFRRRELHEIRPGVYAGAGVKIPDFVVTRTEKGSVVIGEGTTLGSYIVLEGPLLIGEGCVVRDQAVLARASIGDVCKVGGEIEDSVIDAYSNKQHFGYLGHSMVGSWVNLGAGTTASDLKHTYGTVRVDRGSGKEETGMQFCGSFLGDGVKTAINTSLMSGSVVGLNAFVFGTVTGFVPSFASLTRHGLVAMPFEVALTMRERMMARRGITLSAQDRQAFATAYARTAAERIAHHAPEGALRV